jgi:hypothetical protein
MRTTTAGLIGLALLTLVKPPALAQTTNASSGPSRIQVSVNGGYQPTSNDFRLRTTFTEHVELALVDAGYAVKAGPQFDVGGGARVWRSLLVGAAVSRFSRSGTADIAAQIPHPFFFGKSRQVQGTADVERSELAAHVQAAWLVPVTRRIDLVVMAGPSWFSVTQGLVSRVQYRDSYPYDTADFASAAVTRESASALGFNAGLDVTVRVSRYFGVGAFVRVSRASVHFSVADDADTDSIAGGVQTGAGLRMRF